MNPLLRIGRRKFLRDSALGLGVAPLISGASSSGSARAEQKPGGFSSNSSALMMRATFGSKDPVWIVREPHAGFQEQWAACELAGGAKKILTSPRGAAAISYGHAALSAQG